MPQLSWSERFVESFTLARAQRTAETTSESVRGGVADALTLSRQKADAAESLFDNGHPAEALLLAEQALERAIAALEALAVQGVPAPSAPPAPRDDGEAGEGDGEGEEAQAAATPTPDPASDEATPTSAGRPEAVEAPEPSSAPASPTWRRVLEARGVGARELGAIASVLTSTRSRVVPRLDALVTTEHAADFHRILAARAAIDREVQPSALTVTQVRTKRRNRLGLLAFVIVAGALGAFFGLRKPSGTFATASAYFANDAQYGPENVLDGQPSTEWLLPDRTSGWVEINVDPKRRIDAISLLDSINQPHHDRATRDYTIEVWSGGQLARSIEGTMPFSTSPTPVRHEVGVDDVERVRVLVRSWHQLGGGLAEVSFE